MAGSIFDIGQEFDPQIKLKKEASEKAKAAYSLIGSNKLIRTFEDGNRLYHEVTLAERAPELEKQGKIVSLKGVSDPRFTEQVKFLEKLPWQGATLEYFNSKNGLVKREKGFGYETTRPFKWYNNGRSSEPTECISLSKDVVLPLKGIVDIRTKKDYLDGMEKSIADVKAKYDPKQYLQPGHANVPVLLATHLVGFAAAALKDGDVDSAVRAYKLAEGFNTKHVEKKIRQYAAGGQDKQISLRTAFKTYGLVK